MKRDGAGRFGWIPAAALLSLSYGPLEPWFDKSWKPGDIEPVN